jgi:hypothetical protein
MVGIILALRRQRQEEHTFKASWAT